MAKKITLGNAINYFDEQVPNQYSSDDKIKWISELDQIIYDRIIKDRIPNPQGFNGYDTNTSLSTELLVDEPYTEIYRFWMEKNVDFANREINSYNNAAMMYQTYFDNFFAYYNRNNREIAKKQFQYNIM